MDDLGDVEVLAWLCSELRKVHTKTTTYAGLTEEGRLALESGRGMKISEVSLAYDTCVACHSTNPLSQAWPCATLRLVERAERGIDSRKGDSGRPGA